MSGMYKQSKKQWNPFVGCEFHCIYCKSSFQQQMKRMKHLCQQCYDYVPHEHAERLQNYLPTTKDGEFIFVCSCGDISFTYSYYIQKILDKIRSYPDRNFLIQTKDPKTLRRKTDGDLPPNVLVNITLETDIIQDYEKISEAPNPYSRFWDFYAFPHPRKAITIEPIMKFNLNTMIYFMRLIRPERVWIGYESKGKVQLPESSQKETKQLINEIRKLQIPVTKKLIRKAWWEEKDAK